MSVQGYGLLLGRLSCDIPLRQADCCGVVQHWPRWYPAPRVTGRELRKLRVRLRLTQPAFGRRLDLHTNTVYRYEARADARVPRWLAYAARWLEHFA